MVTKQINNGEHIYKEQYIALLDYCFGLWGRKSIEEEWEYLNQKETPNIVLGSIDGDCLASAITLSKRQIYLDAKKVAMYGLGSVVTDSLYRSGGICTNLIKQGMQLMYEKEVPFCMLMPFAYPFYEKLGWIWCYDYKTYQFEIDRLSKFKAKGKIEKITKATIGSVDTYYRQHIVAYNGITIRSLGDWEKKLKFTDNRYGVMVKNQQEQVEGYMIYELDAEKEMFKVMEIEYKTISVLESLLNYIFKHSAQAKEVYVKLASHYYLLDLLDNPKCETKIEAYMMGRIIHLHKALKSYRYEADGEFVIRVQDQLINENTGHFKVKVENGCMVDFIETDEKEDLLIDIKYLTQVILGFRTLKVLEELNQITVYNKEVIKYFKGQASKVALYDYF